MSASFRRPSPAARRKAERGILHGLSLVAFTVLIFGGLAFFALGRFPLRCACKDGTVQDGTRGGFDSARKLCDQVCAQRGGGSPLKKALEQGKDKRAK